MQTFPQSQTEAYSCGYVCETWEETPQVLREQSRIVLDSEGMQLLQLVQPSPDEWYRNSPDLLYFSPGININQWGDRRAFE